MSKIISLFIKFLNRINKFIWKIIIFLSKFIKVDEINHLDDKPEDVKYRLFNVDEPAMLRLSIKTINNLSKIIISNQSSVVMVNLLLLMSTHHALKYVACLSTESTLFSLKTIFFIL